MIINHPHPKLRPHGDGGLAKGSLEVHIGYYDNYDHINHKANIKYVSGLYKSYGFRTKKDTPDGPAMGQWL